jgi:hypothetical protein
MQQPTPGSLRDSLPHRDQRCASVPGDVQSPVLLWSVSQWERSENGVDAMRNTDRC